MRKKEILETVDLLNGLLLKSRMNEEKLYAELSCLKNENEQLKQMQSETHNATIDSYKKQLLELQEVLTIRENQIEKQNEWNERTEISEKMLQEEYDELTCMLKKANICFYVNERYEIGVAKNESHKNFTSPKDAKDHIKRVRKNLMGERRCD